MQKQCGLGWMLTAALAIGLGAVSTAHGEEPFATELSASRAGEFIGDWDVALDFNGNTMNFLLKVVDIDGFVGATIDSRMMPEPQAIENITIDDDGNMVLDYEMSFGQNAFTLSMVAGLVPDGLTGTISEKSGLFKGDFTAKEAVDDPETSEQRRRNRRAAATAASLRFGRDQVRITYADLSTKADEFQQDYEKLGKLKDGEVYTFVSGRATKMFTDVDMHFGDTVIKTQNVAENYPGVYSLWLKKSGDAWSLVFNEETDVWGTMYNPETTVADVPLTLSKADEAAEKFKVELEETANGGELRVLWGEHVWKTHFTVEGFESDKVASQN
jgi:hypothetical protein